MRSIPPMATVALALACATARAQPEPGLAPSPSPDPTPLPVPVPVPPDPSPPPPPRVAPAVTPALAPAPPGSLPSLIPTGASWLRSDRPFPYAPQRRFVAELELFGRGEWVSRGGDAISELRLDRAELGAVAGLGRHAAAELRVEALRSAAEGGALGIDGDTLVTRIKRAQIAGGHVIGPVRLDGAVGLVADPWINALDDFNPARPLSKSASERLLEWSPSDLAIAIRAAVGPARVTITVGNGEGLAYPERNTGKTTTAVAEVVPLARPGMRLRLAAMARNGSIGPASVRDHRYGAAATFSSTHVDAGAEVVFAQGLFARGELEGTAIGGWIDARPIPYLVVAARGGTLRLADGTRTTIGGAIAVEPWVEPATSRGRLRIWLAVDRATSADTGQPLAGADPGDATSVMLIVSALAPFALD